MPFSPPRYFPPRYFPARYFGGAAGAPPTPLPPTLASSIAATANADPALAGIGGGFWDGELPPKQDLDSYCVFQQVGTANLWTTQQSQAVDVRVRFRVYARDGAISAVLGETLRAAALRWGGLRFLGGVSAPLVLRNGLSGPTKDRRIGDKAARYHELTFSAMCVLARA